MRDHLDQGRTLHFFLRREGIVESPDSAGS
jgi:hypothetical protein